MCRSIYVTAMNEPQTLNKLLMTSVKWYVYFWLWIIYLTFHEHWILIGLLHGVLFISNICATNTKFHTGWCVIFTIMNPYSKLHEYQILLALKFCEIRFNKCFTSITFFFIYLDLRITKYLINVLLSSNVIWSDFRRFAIFTGITNN